MPQGYRDIKGSRQSEEGKSTMDVIRQYLGRAPLILAFLALSLGAGWLYIRYKVPKYTASTKILVKEDNKKGNSGDGKEDLLNTAMRGIATVNLDNELQRLRSTQLFERMVQKNGFNTRYFLHGSIRETDIYKAAPFQLEVKAVQDSSNVSFNLTGLSASGAELSTGDVKTAQTKHVRWNEPFTLSGKTFSLAPRASGFVEKAVYVVQWNSVQETARELLDKVGVGTTGDKATIIDISILIENLDRGVDVLNALATEFRLSNVEELNKIAQNTIRFIDDRLAMVSEELKGVESNLENFQGSARAYGLNTQSDQSFTNTDNTAKSLNDLAVQQRLVQMLKQLLTESGPTKVIPSTLGLTDKSVNELISKFNEVQLKKEREAANVGEQSLILHDLNNQLVELKGIILQSLNSLTRNLELQQNSLQQQNSQYNQALSALPRKERLLQEIKRQQGIKEGLFLYLLQKREEAAIARTSQPSNYEQIDPASGWGPVEPNKPNVYKFAFIIGLILPVGLIYTRNFLNEKVISREDIQKKSGLPIVGEISHIARLKGKVLPALGRDLTGEQFRILRSNLAFLQKGKERQVILVTSTSSGEGKSFISLNLAAVLAKAGKKVALLEFDFRKPHDENYGTPSGLGLTDYLSGETSLDNLAQHFEQLPNLHIYPGGSFVQDPGDLILSEKVTELVALVRRQYDAVVINSAPAGLVSDAQILGEYAEAVLYVVRQGTTTKKQLNFMQDLAATQKFGNMCIVFNDVRTGMKYGYDGYGYSKGNSYYNSRSPQKRSLWKKMKNTVGL